MRFPSLMLLLILSLGVQAQEEDGGSTRTSYVSIGDPLVLNLSTGSRRLAFLQIKADIQVNSSAAESAVEDNLPAIRDRLIMILSQQPDSVMKSSSERETVRALATEEIRNMIRDMTNEGGVREVLFTHFLVQ